MTRAHMPKREARARTRASRLRSSSIATTRAQRCPQRLCLRALRERRRAVAPRGLQCASRRIFSLLVLAVILPTWPALLPPLRLAGAPQSILAGVRVSLN